jgi:hypothetical protein
VKQPKLHGDYLDVEAMRNTPAELATYGPAIRDLLARVLDEYGLIVLDWTSGTSSPVWTVANVITRGSSRVSLPVTSNIRFDIIRATSAAVDTYRRKAIQRTLRARRHGCPVSVFLSDDLGVSSAYASLAGIPRGGCLR